MVNSEQFGSTGTEPIILLTKDIQSLKTLLTELSLETNNFYSKYVELASRKSGCCLARLRKEVFNHLMYSGNCPLSVHFKSTHNIGDETIKYMHGSHCYYLLVRPDKSDNNYVNVIVHIGSEEKVAAGRIGLFILSIFPEDDL